MLLDMAIGTTEVLDHLARNGVLLKQDKCLGNVVTILTGESLHTSWWSHPKARVVFAVLAELAEHPDVLFTKLLYGKETLVHRMLWPHFLAVALAGEPWQHRNLSAQARELLRRVLQTEGPVQCSGPAAKELQLKLLAHAEEVHTASGRHEMALESWSAWSERVGVVPTKSLGDARRTIEQACQRLGAAHSALPWSSAAKASSTVEKTE
jgi:hypothetical protein